MRVAAVAAVVDVDVVVVVIVVVALLHLALLNHTSLDKCVRSWGAKRKIKSPFVTFAKMRVV